MSVELQKASIAVRASWYAVAGIVTIVLNPTLFALFNGVFGWNNLVAYAFSLASVNVLQFLWNYFVGFRSVESIGTSAGRQGVVFIASNSLNYGLVVVLQILLPQWKLQVIVVVQAFVAGVKFFAYHYWVYPGHRG